MKYIFFYGGQVVFQGTPDAMIRATTHTAAALKPVLEAGPRVKREKFDPRKIDEEKPGDLAIEEVGKDAAMPWEADGKRWHTKDRINT